MPSDAVLNASLKAFRTGADVSPIVERQATPPAPSEGDLAPKLPAPEPEESRLQQPPSLMPSGSRLYEPFKPDVTKGVDPVPGIKPPRPLDAPPEEPKTAKKPTEWRTGLRLALETATGADIVSLHASDRRKDRQALFDQELDKWSKKQGYENHSQLAAAVTFEEGDTGYDKIVLRLRDSIKGDKDYRGGGPRPGLSQGYNELPSVAAAAAKAEKQGVIKPKKEPKKELKKESLAKVQERGEEVARTARAQEWLTSTGPVDYDQKIHPQKVVRELEGRPRLVHGSEYAADFVPDTEKSTAATANREAALMASHILATPIGEFGTRIFSTHSEAMGGPLVWHKKIAKEYIRLNNLDEGNAEHMRRARNVATKVIAAGRTKGLFAAIFTVPRDQESDESWFSAAAPRVEVLGMDKYGQLHTRTEGPTGYALNVGFGGLEGLISGISRKALLPDMESESWEEASRVGLATRDNMVYLANDLAVEYEVSAPVHIGMIFFALGPSVIIPGSIEAPLIGLKAIGMVGKGAMKAGKAAANTKTAKVVAGAFDSAATRLAPSVVMDAKQARIQPPVQKAATEAADNIHDAAVKQVLAERHGDTATATAQAERAAEAESAIHSEAPGFWYYVNRLSRDMILRIRRNAGDLQKELGAAARDSIDAPLSTTASRLVGDPDDGTATNPALRRHADRVQGQQRTGHKKIYSERRQVERFQTVKATKEAEIADLKKQGKVYSSEGAMDSPEAALAARKARVLAAVEPHLKKIGSIAGKKLTGRLMKTLDELMDDPVKWFETAIEYRKEIPGLYVPAAKFKEVETRKVRLGKAREKLVKAVEDAEEKFKGLDPYDRERVVEKLNERIADIDASIGSIETDYIKLLRQANAKRGSRASLIREMGRIRASAIVETMMDDPVRTLDRAINAVLFNRELRGAAFGLASSIFRHTRMYPSLSDADEMGIGLAQSALLERADPTRTGLRPLAGRLWESLKTDLGRRERLSPPGKLLAKRLEDVFNLSPEQARTLALVEDARIRALSQTTGVPLRMLYRSMIRDIVKGHAPVPKSGAGPEDALKSPEFTRPSPEEVARRRAAKKAAKAARKAGATPKAEVELPDMPPNADGFYSGLLRAAHGLPEKAPPEQLKSMLQSGRIPDVKPNELKFTGILDWLDEKAAEGVKTVSREELISFLKAHEVRAPIVKRGGAADSEATAAIQRIDARLRELGFQDAAIHRAFSMGRVRPNLLYVAAGKLVVAEDPEIQGLIKELRKLADSGEISGDRLAAAIADAEKRQYIYRLLDLAIARPDQRPFLEVEAAAARLEAKYVKNPDVDDQAAVLLPEAIRRADRLADELNAELFDDFAQAQTKLHPEVWKAEQHAWDSHVHEQSDVSLDEFGEFIEEALLQGVIGRPYADAPLTAAERGALEALESAAVKHVDWEPPKQPQWADYTSSGGTNYRENVHVLEDGTEFRGNAKVHHHWGESDVIAHSRSTDRVSEDGLKLKHADEVQNDWAQGGQEFGFEGPEVAAKRAELARVEAEYDKAAVQYAHETEGTYWKWSEPKNGEVYRQLYDSAAGRFIADMNPTYRIRQHADGRWVTVGFRDFVETLKPYDTLEEAKASTLVQLGKNISAGALPGAVSRELSDKLGVIQDTIKRLKLETKYAVPDHPFPRSAQWAELALKALLKQAADEGLDGLSLNPGDVIRAVVGGEPGNEKFYDEILPLVLKKIGARWGVELKKTTVNLGEFAPKELDFGVREVWYLPITDAMRGDVRVKGQTLFQPRKLNEVEKARLRDIRQADLDQGILARNADGEVTAKLHDAASRLPKMERGSSGLLVHPIDPVKVKQAETGLRNAKMAVYNYDLEVKQSLHDMGFRIVEDPRYEGAVERVTDALLKLGVDQAEINKLIDQGRIPPIKLFRGAAIAELRASEASLSLRDHSVNRAQLLYNAFRHKFDSDLDLLGHGTHGRGPLNVTVGGELLHRIDSSPLVISESRLYKDVNAETLSWTGLSEIATSAYNRGLDDNDVLADMVNKLFDLRAAVRTAEDNLAKAHRSPALKGVSDIHQDVRISSDPAKMVEEVNEMAWFHGSRRGDIRLREYDLAEHSGTGAGNMLGDGLYLASDPEIAIGGYALGPPGTSGKSPSLLTVDVSTRSLLDLRGSTQDMLDALLDAGAIRAMSEIEQFALSRGVSTDAEPAFHTWRRFIDRNRSGDIQEELLQFGIDGLLHRGGHDGNVLVLFDPTASKLSGAKPVIRREHRVMPERTLFQPEGVTPAARTTGGVPGIKRVAVSKLTEAAGEARSAKKVAAWLADNAVDEVDRTLAASLADAIDDSIGFEVVDLSRLPDAFGTFTPGRGIAIGDRDGLAEYRTVLHELVHAAVVQRMERAARAQDSVEGFAVMDLARMRDQAAEAGLIKSKDLDEFVANALTDRTLQAALRDLEWRGPGAGQAGSLWQRFVDAVTRLLVGDKGVDNNLLMAVTDRVGILLEMPPPRKASVRGAVQADGRTIVAAAEATPVDRVIAKHRALEGKVINPIGMRFDLAKVAAEQADSISLEVVKTLSDEVQLVLPTMHGPLGSVGFDTPVLLHLPTGRVSQYDTRMPDDQNLSLIMRSVKRGQGPALSDATVGQKAAAVTSLYLTLGAKTGLQLQEAGLLSVPAAAAYRSVDRSASARLGAAVEEPMGSLLTVMHTEQLKDVQSHLQRAQHRARQILFTMAQQHGYDDEVRFVRELDSIKTLDEHEVIDVRALVEFDQDMQRLLDMGPDALRADGQGEVVIPLSAVEREMGDPPVLRQPDESAPASAFTRPSPEEIARRRAEKKAAKAARKSAGVRREAPAGGERRPALRDGFYSRAEANAMNLPRKASIDEIKQKMVPGGEVPRSGSMSPEADEIRWNGLFDWLDEQAAAGRTEIPRSEIVEYLRAHDASPQLKVLGDAGGPERAAAVDQLTSRLRDYGLTEDHIHVAVAEGRVMAHRLTDSSIRKQIVHDVPEAAALIKLLADKAAELGDTKFISRQIIGAIDESYSQFGSYRELIHAADQFGYNAAIKAAKEDLLRVRPGVNEPGLRLHSKMRAARKEQARRMNAELFDDFAQVQTKLHPEVWKAERAAELVGDRHFVTPSEIGDMVHSHRMVRAIDGSDLSGPSQLVQGFLQSRHPALDTAAFDEIAAAVSEAIRMRQKHAGWKPAAKARYQAMTRVPRGVEGYAENLHTINQKAGGGALQYREPHYRDVPGVVVHSRAGNYESADGKVKVALEIQATGHQRARKHGYVGDAPSADRVQQLKAAEDQARNDLAEQIDHAIEWRLDPANTEEWQPGRLTTAGEFLFLSDETAFSSRIVQRTDGNWQVVSKPEVYATQQQAQLAATRSELVNTYDTETLIGVLEDTRELYHAYSTWVASFRDLNAAFNPSLIPDMPFKSTNAWTGLALKHLLQQAVDEGLDGLAIQPGRQVNIQVDMPLGSAEEYYNGIVPERLLKIAKRFGFEGDALPTTKVQLGNDYVDMPYLPITDEMRASVSGKGHTFYSPPMQAEEAIDALAGVLSDLKVEDSDQMRDLLYQSGLMHAFGRFSRRGRARGDRAEALRLVELLKERIRPQLQNHQRLMDRVAQADQRILEAPPGWNESRHEAFMNARRAVDESAAKLKGMVELESKKLVATPPDQPRRAGAQAITSRLEMEEKFGKIEDGAELAEIMRPFFKMMGAEDTLKGTRFTITGEPGEGAGWYDFINDIITLHRKSIDFDDPINVLVHEAFHAASRHMPDELLKDLYKQYHRERAAYRQAKPQFFNDDGSLKSVKGRPRGAYRYKNFDEWFAESLTDHAERRFAQAERTATSPIFEGFLQWLETVRAWVVDKLGYDKSARIIDDLVAGRYAQRQSDMPLGARVGSDWAARPGAPDVPTGPSADGMKLDPLPEGMPWERAFDDMATQQRGVPERAGEDIRGSSWAPATFAWGSEHIGDITHRMAQSPEFFRRGGNGAKGKIRKLHRALSAGPPDSMRHMDEILQQAQRKAAHHQRLLEEGKSYADADIAASSQEDVMRWAREMGQKYADEHRKLPVYNRAQWLAREAAIAYGEFRFDDALRHITELKQHVDAGPEAWTKFAHARPGAAEAPLSAAQKAENLAEFMEGSVVKNADGSPMVVHHGTSVRQDFSEFDTSESLGAHFGTQEAANDAVVAGAATELRHGIESPQRVYPVYLSIKNPYELPDLQRWDQDEIIDLLKADDQLDESLWPGGYRGLREDVEIGGDYEPIQDFLKRNGYDGVVYYNMEEGVRVGADGRPTYSKSWIVFDPEQVKSATGNRGTYGPRDPNILYQPGRVDTPAFREWYGKDNPIRDEAGKPIPLYRGSVIRGEAQDEMLRTQQPRSGYAAFASDNPHVAATYSGGAPDFPGGGSGAIAQVYVRATRLIEFPVREGKYGRSFDMFEFDRQASQLGPGEVLVARQVYDNGPRSSKAMDPDGLRHTPSDIYAWGEGTSVKSPYNRGTWNLNEPDTLHQLPDLFRNTPEFKAWSRGLPEVAAGEELPAEGGFVVRAYTGTSKDHDFGTVRTGRRGAFFTRDPEEASHFAIENDSRSYQFDPDARRYREKNTQSRVIPVHLRMENPYRPSDFEIRKFRFARDYAAAEREMADAAKRAGHDGIVRQDGSLIIFSGNQVKSVNNRGTYDKTGRLLNAPGERALVEFFDDGSAVIRALENPDASSAFHELTHVARRNLPAAAKARLVEWFKKLGYDVELAPNGKLVDSAQAAEEKAKQALRQQLYDLELRRQEMVEQAKAAEATKGGKARQRAIDYRASADAYAGAIRDTIRQLGGDAAAQEQIRAALEAQIQLAIRASNENTVATARIRNELHTTRVGVERTELERQLKRQLAVATSSRKKLQDLRHQLDTLPEAVPQADGMSDTVRAAEEAFAAAVEAAVLKGHTPGGGRMAATWDALRAYLGEVGNVLPKFDDASLKELAEILDGAHAQTRATDPAARARYLAEMKAGKSEQRMIPTHSGRILAPEGLGADMEPLSYSPRAWFISEVESVVETMPHRSVYQALEGEVGTQMISRFVGKWAATKIRMLLTRPSVFLTFGGNEFRAELMKLRPAERLIVLDSSSIVEESLGNAARLTHEVAAVRGGDTRVLIDFLDGKRVRFHTGRHAPGSGHDHATPVAKSIVRSWDALTPAHQDALLKAAAAARRNAEMGKSGVADLKGEPGDISFADISGLDAKTTELANEAVQQLIYENNSSWFLQDWADLVWGRGVAEGIGPKAATKSISNDPMYIVGPLQLLAAAGVRDVAGALGKTWEPMLQGSQSERLLAAAYAGAVGKDADKAAARLHAGLLIAAHGSTERAYAFLRARGLIFSAEDAESYSDYLQGLLPPGASKDRWDKLVERGRQLTHRYGLGLDLTPEPTLGALKKGERMPQAAAKRIQGSISKARTQISSEEKISRLLGTPLEEGDKEMTAVDAALMTIFHYYQVHKTSGVFQTNQWYPAQNWLGHIQHMYMRTTARAAAVSATRLAPQVPLSNPTISSSLGITSWARTEAARKAAGGLPEAPGAIVERAREVLQALGDKAAGVVNDVTRAAPTHTHLDKIYAGSDHVLEFVDSLKYEKGLADGLSKAEALEAAKVTYTGGEIRDAFVRTRVYASFDRSELEAAIFMDMRRVALQDDAVGQSVRLIFAYPNRARRFVRDVAESFGERERVGAALTMMDAGLRPDDAGRVTVEALFDYATSRGGTIERDNRMFSMIWRANSPYWTWRKNAQRQAGLMLTSPTLAYRAGIYARAYNRGPEALSLVMYENLADHYGIDQQALSTEGAAKYAALAQRIEHGNGPVDQWTTQDQLNFILGHLANVEAEALTSGDSTQLAALQARLREPDHRKLFWDMWGASTEEDQDLWQNGYGSYREVPAKVKEVVGMLLRGRTQSLDPKTGGVSELPLPIRSALKDPELSGAHTESGAVTYPGSTMRPAWMDGRPTATITMPPGTLYKDQAFSIMMPDDVLATSYGGLMLLMGTAAATAAWTAQWAADEEPQFNPFDALMANADPRRAMMLGDIAQAAGVVESMPVRLPPVLGALAMDNGISGVKYVQGVHTGAFDEDGEPILMPGKESRYYIFDPRLAAVYRNFPFSSELVRGAAPYMNVPPGVGDDDPAWDHGDFISPRTIMYGAYAYQILTGKPLIMYSQAATLKQQLPRYQRTSRLPTYEP